MKNIICLVAILLSFNLSVAHAGELECYVNETSDGETSETKIVIEVKEENSHGDVKPFKLVRFSEYTGIVAYLKGYAVMNLYHEPSGIGSSSFGDVSNNKVAHHQIVMSSTEKGTRSIVIDCALVK